MWTKRKTMNVIFIKVLQKIHPINILKKLKNINRISGKLYSFIKSKDTENTSNLKYTVPWKWISFRAASDLFNLLEWNGWQEGCWRKTVVKHKRNWILFIFLNNHIINNVINWITTKSYVNRNLITLPTRRLRQTNY